MYQIRLWKSKFFGVMKFYSCIFRGQKMQVLEILGHQNPYFLIRNLNFWSKVVILKFWSSHCFRLLRPCTKWRGQRNKNNVVPSIFIKFWSKKNLIVLISWLHKTSTILGLTLWIQCSFEFKFDDTSLSLWYKNKIGTIIFLYCVLTLQSLCPVGCLSLALNIISSSKNIQALIVDCWRLDINYHHHITDCPYCTL